MTITTRTPGRPPGGPHAVLLAALCLLLAWGGGACGPEPGDDDTGGGDDDAADDDDTGGGEIDIAICAADHGPFTVTIDHTYLPFTVGAVHVLEGLEGGVDPIRLQITVLDETVEVDGVATRVVLEEEWEDEEYAGAERHYVTQAPDGTVCYYGTEDQWMAGEDGAEAGILMPGAPAVGQVFEMIHTATHTEVVEIASMGTPVETPAGTFDDTVIIVEPGPSIKSYAAGIGLVDDDGIGLTSH